MNIDQDSRVVDARALGCISFDEAGRRATVHSAETFLRVPAQLCHILGVARLRMSNPNLNRPRHIYQYGGGAQ